MPPKTSGTHYGGGHHGQGQRGLLDDFTGVKKHAKQHAGDSGDDSMFSSALNMLQEKQGSLQNESVDEEHAVNSHQSFFGSGGSSGGESTSSGMGAAAAMQALKMYSSGSSSSSSSEGGGSSQEFMGMAMGQAAKLFGKCVCCGWACERRFATDDVV